MAENLQMQAQILTFLPIAHFSPACCLMLETYLASAEYDTLFVELPAEGQTFLPALIDKETVPPLSMLFLTGETSRILPLTSYSPELVACRAAAAAGKKVVFIDSASFSSGQAEPFGAGAAENACDFLERAVEMNYRLPPDEFFSNLHALGNACKGEVTERELFMASVISAHSYGRALAVVGAAHCDNVSASLSEPLALTPSDCESYLIPYIPDSYPLPHYGFYRALRAEMGRDGEAFFACAVAVLTEAVRTVARDFGFEQIPLTDIINTVVHAELLSRFRAKPLIGCLELTESALSVIAKGDESSVRRRVLADILEKTEGGELSARYDTPLLRDYHASLKSLRITAEAGARTVLETLAKPDHRKKSAFFRKLAFIGAPLAEKISGADYVTGQQKNLTRETWKIGVPFKTEGAIIRLSHLGATVDEVAEKRLGEAVEDTMLSNAPALAASFMNAYFMGLDGRRAFDKLCRSVQHINDFSSAVEALARVSYLIEVKNVLDGSRPRLDLDLAGQLYLKAVGLMRGIGRDEEGEEETDRLAELGNLLTVCDYLDKELFIGQLDGFSSFTHPCVYGGVCALRARFSLPRSMEQIGNFLTTEPEPVRIALFLLGCGKTNRGIMTDIRLLSAVASFLENLTLNEFLECAPCLRYAFSPLNRSEKAAVTEFIGRRYEGETPDFEAEPQLLLKDEYLAGQLALYGIGR